MNKKAFDARVGPYFITGRFWLDAHTMLSYNASIECDELNVREAEWGLKTPTAARRWLRENKARVLSKARKAFTKYNKERNKDAKKYALTEKVRCRIYNKIKHGPFNHEKFYREIVGSADTTIKKYYGLLRSHYEHNNVYSLSHTITCDIVSSIVLAAIRKKELEYTHHDRPALPFIRRYLRG